MRKFINLVENCRMIAENYQLPEEDKLSADETNAVVQELHRNDVDAEAGDLLVFRVSSAFKWFFEFIAGQLDEDAIWAMVDEDLVLDDYWVDQMGYERADPLDDLMGWDPLEKDGESVSQEKLVQRFRETDEFKNNPDKYVYFSEVEKWLDANGFYEIRTWEPRGCYVVKLRNGG